MDRKPGYKEKYMKSKMKSYPCKIKANFYDNKIPKKSFECIYQIVTGIDFIYKYAGSKQNTQNG